MKLTDSTTEDNFYSGLPQNIQLILAPMVEVKSVEQLADKILEFSNTASASERLIAFNSATLNFLDQ